MLNVIMLNVVMLNVVAPAIAGVIVFFGELRPLFIIQDQLETKPMEQHALKNVKSCQEYQNLP
jgi:hypothetical protein